MKKVNYFLILLIAILILSACSGEGPATASENAPSLNAPSQSAPAQISPSKIPPTKNAPARPTQFFLADRVINNSDYALLAAGGINTAVVQFEINWDPAVWKDMLQAARDARINIVLWPTDWENKRADCDTGFAYPASADGDITKVKPLLEFASAYPNFIGVVSAHEWMWTSCPMTFNEMAGLKTQLKAYLATFGRADVKVWNYTNSLARGYASSALPDDQIARIMDVAVIWKHCAGNSEGTCDISLETVRDSRRRLASLHLESQVELVYLIQTFTSGGKYAGKFTLSDLEAFGCQVLRTSALDGFGFYTWDAGWWPDLHAWPDLQPAIPYIYNNCTDSIGDTSILPTITP